MLYGLIFRTAVPDAPAASSSAEMGMVLLEEEHGMYVLAVSEQSEASLAGIKPGDYLLRLQETPLMNMMQLDGLMARPRDVLQLTILMLSARGEEYDRIHGFELGVDDYVVKPSLQGS